jgi:integrase
MVHLINHSITDSLPGLLYSVAVILAAMKVPGMASAKTKKYKLPRLVDHDGDLSKRWYIIFYVPDKNSGELVRKRTVQNLNQLKTKEARYRAANDYIAQISDYLKKGYVHEAPEKNKKWEPKTLADLITWAIEIKSKELSKNYLASHKLILEYVKKYQASRKLQPLKSLKAKDFFDLLTYFQNQNGFGPKTFNTYLGIISACVEMAVKNDFLEINYAARVDKQKVKSGELHLPFTKEQVKEIKRLAMEEGNHQFCLFVDFCIYTLARPRVELHQLKVKEIREKTIYIPKQRGKTGGRIIPLLKPLKKLIEENKLKEYPRDFYVFGKGGKPAPQTYTSTHFYDHLNRYLKKMGLFGKGYTLYGLKHTGAIHAKINEVPLSIIQILCGHKNPEQTRQYLINLDMINPLEDYLDNFPEF